MTRSELRDWTRRYLIVAFLVVILVVQSGAALSVSEGWIRRGFFEWSFLVKPGAALFLMWVVDGNRGVMGLLKPLFKWQVHLGWHLFALVSLPLLLVLSVGIHSAIYGNEVHFNPWSLTGFYPKMYLTIFSMAIADELAFFGFVYARLAPRYTGLVASGIAASAWTVSYAPRMLMESEMMADNSMPFWVLGANFFALAPLCAWVYGSTKSAFLVVVLQVAANFATLSMPILPKHTGVESTYLCAIIITGIASLVVAKMYGAKHLTKSGLPLPAS